MVKPELAEIDANIAKAEHLVEIATECGFQDLATAIRQDLATTKAWNDLAADALKRARSPGRNP